MNLYIFACFCQTCFYCYYATYDMEPWVALLAALSNIFIFLSVKKQNATFDMET